MFNIGGILLYATASETAPPYGTDVILINT